MNEGGHHTRQVEGKEGAGKDGEMDGEGHPPLERAQPLPAKRFFCHDRMLAQLECVTVLSVDGASRHVSRMTAAP